MNKIPVIDLSKAMTGSLEDRKAVAREIDEAYKSIGFITVKGHGIDKSVFENAYQSLDAFFALPLDEKYRCTTDVRPCPWQTNGYSRLLEENAHKLMGKEGPGDYVEKFSMGRSVLSDELPLPFPADPSCDGIRQNMKRYYEACIELTNILTGLFALVLDLPEDHFVDKVDKSWDNLRLHRYPAIEGLINDQGVAEHKDTDFLTIVTNVEDGMEVLTKEGDWIDVKTDSIDQFVINIGDILQRWSNDEYVSILHRVKLTKDPRRSIIFIKGVNMDGLVETFPKFLKDGKSNYEPITYGEFISQKAAQMYGKDFLDKGKIDDSPKS
ncbi:MAG: isopenicillin N synthase family oxygenase [Algicola sp.]|nr:isopenicillin N synthase family oxygenase [Algicola sp.]